MATTPIKYRISSVATKPTADSVKGAALTSLEIDGNFRSLKDSIETESERIDTIVENGFGVMTVAASAPLSSSGGANPSISFTGILAAANGGTGVAGVNGIMKGNGANAVTAATAGSDYLTPAGSETLTNKNLTSTTNTFPTTLATLTGTEALTNKDLTSTTNTFPSSFVTLTGTQALTNKDLTAATNTFPATLATLTGTQTLTNKDLTSTTNTFPTTLATLTGTQTLTNKTVQSVKLNSGYTEEIFAVTGTTPAISPTNGSIQTWTLTGNSTPTAGTWNAGQSITLMIDDGSSFTINWSSLAVVWFSNFGVAPTLKTTGYTAVQLWKVGTVIYGSAIGDEG